jgi:hypothetical protein
LRIGAAILLFVAAMYWVIAAAFEIVAARKPPRVFGATLLRTNRPEPVLTMSQWRKGGVFLLAMAAALVAVGIRLIQGW